MKIKERYVWLVCSECGFRHYVTHKRVKATYKVAKKKYCKLCRKHTPHKEKKL